MTFEGFPAGRLRTFALPETFISDVLPLIDEVTVLQVVLTVFRDIQRRDVSQRWITEAMLLASPDLARVIEATVPWLPVHETIVSALNRAVELHVLLSVTIRHRRFTGGTMRVILVNTQMGRETGVRFEAGDWQLEDDGTLVLKPESAPNTFRLYEQYIGPLTPMIADALKDAEREYPAGWTSDAIRIAVEANGRSWRFIQAVLERWKREGKRDGKTIEAAEQPDERDGRRFAGGAYADFIEH